MEILVHIESYLRNIENVEIEKRKVFLSLIKSLPFLPVKVAETATCLSQLMLCWTLLLQIFPDSLDLLLNPRFFQSLSIDMYTIS